MPKKSQQDSSETPVESLDSYAELVDLIKKNIALSDALYKQNVKIHKKLKWMSIMGMVRFFIFLVPLILGIIFLPPLLGGVWEQYQSLLGISTSSGLNIESFKALIEQF